MRATTILGLALSLAASVGFADELDQLPPGKWWENPQLVQRIGLGDEQQQRIRDVVYQHALKMIDLKAGLERSQLELRELVDRTPLDPDAVRAAFAVFQGARQRLETERFEMLLAVRQILNASQWSELQRLRREFERRRPGVDPERRPPLDRRPYLDGPPQSRGQRPPGAG